MENWTTGYHHVAGITLPLDNQAVERHRDHRVPQTGTVVGECLLCGENLLLTFDNGGIRTSKDAIKYLVMVNEIAGTDWLDPDWFRFGASTLLNDLLMQRTKMATGRYSGPDYFTLD